MIAIIISSVHDCSVYCQVQDIVAEAVRQGTDGVNKNVNTYGHTWLPVNAIHDQT